MLSLCSLFHSRLYERHLSGKKKTFDPIPGVNGICKGILFANMLLYIPFPFN